MRKIALALLIGIIVGIIDVIPMYFMELSWYASMAAFVHWIVLGLIIPFVNWCMKSWIKGIVIATLSAIPVIIQTIELDYSSIVPILSSSVVLGALTGLAGERFVH